MRDPTHVRVGRLVKAARIRTQRTQKELAQLANISQTTLARYETGIQPTPRRRLQQFADLLSAPELIQVADLDLEVGAVAPDARSRRSLGSGVDLFTAREGIYDWWTTRVEQLRRKERLSPLRVDAIRLELSRTTLAILANAAIQLNDTTDKFLLECLEALLQVQLRVERLSASAKGRSAA